MAAYNKVNNSRVGVVRKLTDYYITVKGREVEMTRVGVDPDIWGNADTKALSDDSITAIVTFPPGELPILRVRDALSDNVSGGSAFFYDILPVEAYFKFKDRVERGDIFYFTVEDELKNKMPIILKVCDLTGGVTTKLIWRKFLCSPVTGLHELAEETQARVLEKIGVVTGMADG